MLAIQCSTLLPVKWFNAMSNWYATFVPQSGSEYKFNFHEGDNAAKNERETDEGQDNGTTASVYLKV